MGNQRKMLYFPLVGVSYSFSNMHLFCVFIIVFKKILFELNRTENILSSSFPSILFFLLIVDIATKKTHTHSVFKITTG